MSDHHVAKCLFFYLDPEWLTLCFHYEDGLNEDRPLCLPPLEFLPLGCLPLLPLPLGVLPLGFLPLGLLPLGLLPLGLLRPSGRMSLSRGSPSGLASGGPKIRFVLRAIRKGG